jgi:hypothetical protein
MTNPLERPGDRFFWVEEKRLELQKALALPADLAWAIAVDLAEARFGVTETEAT